MDIVSKCVAQETSNFFSNLFELTIIGFSRCNMGNLDFRVFLELDKK